ncbi:MAG: acyltransferase [Symploca sp. SIO2D2]|nr:acyltransferase [Symploca sp. SIO2D2]
MKKILAILSLFLPWSLKRRLLERFFGYQLHPTAYIGCSLVMSKQLIMGPQSRIGQLTVIKDMEIVSVGERSRIGDFNWIYGFPKHPKHFAHQEGRKSILDLRHDSAITKRHIIDCTNAITIEPFSTIAGFRSQFLTHSVDVFEGRQDSHPIHVGKYCFVGTDCVILGGAKLPDYSVLGAKSLLNKPFEECHMLYAGVPAKAVKDLPKDARYFTRERGFID